MNRVFVRDAVPGDVAHIRQIAEQTWWPTYTPIVEKEQIRYMLDVIYDPTVLNKAMAEGSQTFLMLEDDDGPQGFASYSPRPEDPRVVKLHKLYVLPANHGKGYGKTLIEEIRQRIHQTADYLDLNVNRQNPAISFYKKSGFTIIKEEDVAIGAYWMTDYVMRLDLKNTH
ncbi:MAG TPA: GNAT family N-acetyltransferase [Ohtaekwangia sp.]|nr:GNAT family N-acetyltransferase [Ohtaekwangia sp.]